MIEVETAKICKGRNQKELEEAVPLELFPNKVIIYDFINDVVILVYIIFITIFIRLIAVK